MPTGLVQDCSLRRREQMAAGPGRQGGCQQEGRKLKLPASRPTIQPASLMCCQGWALGF